MTEATVARGRPRVREERVERLHARLGGLGARTFLVIEPLHVFYLTGFESSNAAALVAPDRLLLLTDGRYVEAARDVEGAEVVLAERELAPWLGGRLADLAEPPVAFEAGRLPYAAYDALAASGLELLPAPPIVEELRSVKDADELDAVRRAARILNAVYERLAAEAFVGKTEAEIAWSVEELLHEEGAESSAFPPIVAAGPNAALPHHHPRGRRIERGETVIVDAGAKVGGYCSDCTRTFATGALPPELARAYDVCLAAQKAALAEVGPGAAAQRLDFIARDRIDRAGHEVLHGLGHGVGLAVHELPRLAHTSDETLAPGNVVTVEPGVYVPGLGGVRIEDLVIVTAGGAEVLTPLTKDLTTVR